MDKLLNYIWLQIAKFLVWILDQFLGLFGWTITRGRRQHGDGVDYETSGQLVDVIYRAKPTTMTTRLDNYLYTHTRYVHPNYVLENKNITLLAVEKTYALFCVTESDVDIHDSSRFTFMFDSQYQEPKQLVILPIKSFHRLAEAVGDPKMPVVMMNMTTRCGSTLLVQMMNLVPGTRAMSECWAMVNIHQLRAEGRISREESLEMIRSAVRLHCKVSPGEKIENIFMKMTPTNSPIFPDIMDIFPNFTYIFNTRHPVPMLISSKKMNDTILKGNWYEILGFGWRFRKAHRFTFPYSEKYDKLLYSFSSWWPHVDDDEFGIIWISGVIAEFFDNKSRYNDVILYEDLCVKPEQELKKIFKALHISEDHLSLALQAMNKDSQKGQYGKRGVPPTLNLPADLLVKFDAYMYNIGVPLRSTMSVTEYEELFRK